MTPICVPPCAVGPVRESLWLHRVQGIMSQASSADRHPAYFLTSRAEHVLVRGRLVTVANGTRTFHRAVSITWYSVSGSRGNSFTIRRFLTGIHRDILLGINENGVRLLLTGLGEIPGELMAPTYGEWTCLLDLGGVASLCVLTACSCVFANGKWRLGLNCLPRLVSLPVFM
jgi:hypothetical protein